MKRKLSIPVLISCFCLTTPCVTSQITERGITKETQNSKPEIYTIDYSFPKDSASDKVNIGFRGGMQARYQTFTPSTNSDLTKVTIMLGKETGTNDRVLGDVNIFLYEVDTSIALKNPPLAKVAIPAANIKIDAPTSVALPYRNLKKRVRYAIVVAPDGMDGATEPHYSEAGKYTRYTIYRKTDYTAEDQYANRCDIFTNDSWDQNLQNNYHLYLKLDLSGETPAEANAKRMIVEQASYDIIKGGMVTPKITVFDKENNVMEDVIITLSSAMPSIARKSGLSILGIAPGMAVFTAKCGALTLDFTVNVSSGAPARIGGNPNMAVAAGEIFQGNYGLIDDLKKDMPALQPQLKYEIPVQYASVATVSATGKITAKSKGEAMMTVSYAKLKKFVRISVYDTGTEQLYIPVDGAVITAADAVNGIVRFAPGTYTLPNGIVIGDGNFTIDGNGATIQRTTNPMAVHPSDTTGTCDPWRGKGYGAAFNSPPGNDGLYPLESISGEVTTGIMMTEKNNVTIKNLTITKYNRAMYVKGGVNLTIENNNFSNNFNFKYAYWGDGPGWGALCLDDVHNSVVRYNTGCNNWNGIELRHSNKNKVYYNDFSECSSVPLKLWGASYNEIEDNHFTWGVRLEKEGGGPGDVHARDSTGALLEGASMFNYFARNSFNFGGDGIYTRWNHGCFPMGNYWLENEIGWCNNNSVESQSPANTYVHNNIYNSSFGMWISYSDFTCLIENRIYGNGGTFGGPSNAGQPYGNGGITSSGSSAHYFIMDNIIENNTGHGIAAENKAENPFHWLIQNNVISNNKGGNGRGVYFQNVRWMDLLNNVMNDNQVSDIHVQTPSTSSGVNDQGNGSATKLTCSTGRLPVLDIVVSPVQAAYSLADMHWNDIPEKMKDACFGITSLRYVSVRQGETIIFNGSGALNPSGRPMTFRWEFGDGEAATTAKATHVYNKPGIYRCGFTAYGDTLANMQGYVVTVVPPGNETGTDSPASEWSISGGNGATVSNTPFNAEGNTAIEVKSYGGANFSLQYPVDRNLNGFSGANYLSFQLRSFVEETGQQAPRIRLYKDENNYIEYRAKKYFFSPSVRGRTEPVHAHCYGFQHIEIDLKESNENFTRSVTGSAEPNEVKWIEFYGGDRNGRATFTFDGIKLH